MHNQKDENTQPKRRTEKNYNTKQQRLINTTKETDTHDKRDQ